MPSPNRQFPQFVLPGILSITALASAGCESPEEGFAKAEDFNSLESWQEFIEKHGEDFDRPKVAEGRERLAGRMLEDCKDSQSEGASAECFTPIWRGFAGTQAGRESAAAQGGVALDRCDADARTDDAADHPGCVADVAKRFKGFDVGARAAEQAAEFAIAACLKGSPTPQCLRAIAEAWDGTEAARGAVEVADLLGGPAEAKGAWLRKNPASPGATVLRTGLCLGKKVLIFEDAEKQRLALDGVAAVVRIRAAQMKLHPVSKPRRPSLSDRLEAAGCSVKRWTEPEVAVNIATGRKEVWDGEVHHKYRPGHKLKKAHRAKYDLIVWSRATAVESLKKSYNSPLKIRFKLKTEVSGKGQRRGRTVKQKWTYKQRQGLGSEAGRALVKEAARELDTQLREHALAVLALADGVLVRSSADTFEPPQPAGDAGVDSAP